MAGYYKRQDLTQQIRVMQEQIRRLQSRVNPGPNIVITHNFIVGGPVDTALYIPPANVHTATSGENFPTSVAWYGFRGAFARVGSVAVQWLLNDSTVLPADYVELNDGDHIRPQLTTASGAEDLTAWYTLIYNPV
jgi:hypothetical protein